MENPVNIVKGVICGLIFLAAVIWQLRIYHLCSGYDEYDSGWNDIGWDRATRVNRAKRTILLTFGLPGGISGVVVLLAAIGALALCILTAIDGKPVDWMASLRFFGAVLAVSVAFFLKQCINVVLLGATATWTVYQLLFNGEVSFIPVFRMLFDFVASSAPGWI